ncbi:MAG: hypothetical protein FVQ79_09585 [Planctomycetes bacterium]|nr:hypothetical protein [Planctomycetota bacterium]
MAIKTEYKDGTMIVTHPSGHVDIYTPADLKKERDEKQSRLNDLQNQIADDNILISSMEA